MTNTIETHHLLHSAPQLLRAKESIYDGAPLRHKGEQWETGLSFDELRAAIGKGFTGIPGKIDGEPICNWMLTQCRSNDKVTAEAMTCIVSFPLHEAMTRRRYMDLSIRTQYGILASTAVVLEYEPRNVFWTWWDKIWNTYQENMLFFKLWRQGALPELITSKEWKAERADVYRRAYKTVRIMSAMHKQHGPPHRHWYVNTVASNPDLQGQGYGSQLMRKVCELADKERADCYLECGSEKNVKFYEKFGFAVVASQVLDDTTTSGKVDAGELTTTAYVMVRNHQW